MSVEFIKYENMTYPKFQSEGNASQFAIPFAKHFCKGNGLDVGCNRIEWAFPGAVPIDISFGNGFDAYRLPDGEFDYVYSSHCLEHLDDWVGALEYWISKLKDGGVLFLYLPDASQKYWRPWHNRKHKHCFTQDILMMYFKDVGLKNIFVSGVDLNNSFIIVGEK